MEALSDCEVTAYKLGSDSCLIGAISMIYSIIV